LRYGGCLQCLVLAQWQELDSCRYRGGTVTRYYDI
jgi:hypothetical protein